MEMKFLTGTFKYIICLMALTAVGCQGSKETIKEVVREPMPKSNYGGQDSGGGDCVKSSAQCFPIEDFRVEIRTQPAFSQVLTPIIEALAALHPRLAADLHHISQERTWYRLPVALDALPYEIKGISFASQQMALQNLKAVFIDDNLYGPNTATSQAKLVLHELLMGVRLMEYQSDLDRCFAGAAQQLLKGGTREAWKEKRNHCYKSQNPLATGREINLTKVDYENVRTLTSKIFYEIDRLDKDELQNWLEKNHFRSYDNKYYDQ